MTKKFIYASGNPNPVAFVENDKLTFLQNGNFNIAWGAGDGLPVIQITTNSENFEKYMNKLKDKTNKVVNGKVTNVSR